MRYDWLLDPISEGTPCGPDLDEVGDEKYLGYVLPVAGRIPERYYKANTDEPIDRGTIKLKEELEAIGGLLRPDPRHSAACIEARFQSFVGDLSGFADCIVAIAGLARPLLGGRASAGIRGRFHAAPECLERPRRLVADHPAAAASAAGPRQARGPRRPIASLPSPAGRHKSAPTKPRSTLTEIHRALSAPENRAASDRSFKAAINAAAALASRSAIRSHRMPATNMCRATTSLPNSWPSMVALFRTARPDLADSAVGQQQAAAVATDEQAETAAAGGAGAIGAKAYRIDGIDQKPSRCGRGTVGRRDLFRGQRAVVAGADPRPPGAVAGRQVADTFA